MHNLTMKSLSATWVLYDDICEVCWGLVLPSAAAACPWFRVDISVCDHWEPGELLCPQVLSKGLAHDGGSVTISEMNKWMNM